MGVFSYLIQQSATEQLRTQKVTSRAGTQLPSINWLRPSLSGHNPDIAASLLISH